MGRERPAFLVRTTLSGVPPMSVLFCFHPPATAITLNQRHHWAAHARLVKEWRTAGMLYARKARIGPQPPSRIAVTLPVTGRRRRDPHNWTPTVKAIVDGLVDAGVIRDDSGEFVDAVTYRRPVVEAGSLPALIVLVREGEGR